MPAKKQSTVKPKVAAAAPKGAAKSKGAAKPKGAAKSKSAAAAKPAVYVAEDESDAVDLDTLSVDEVRAVAASLGVATTGAKAAVLARIHAHAESLAAQVGDAAPAAKSSAPASKKRRAAADDDAVIASGDSVDLHSLGVEELRAVAATLGLPTTGAKAALLSRIHDHAEQLLEDDENGVDLESMNVDEIRLVAESLTLATTGTKAALLARIHAHAASLAAAQGGDAAAAPAAKKRKTAAATKSIKATKATKTATAEKKAVAKKIIASKTVKATKAAAATKAKATIKAKAAPKKAKADANVAVAAAATAAAAPNPAPITAPIAAPTAAERERAEFARHVEAAEAMSIADLKTALQRNRQKKSGTKKELVERVADCQTYGCLPACPECNGFLRVQYAARNGHGGGGDWRCPGRYDDDEFKYCSFRAHGKLERPAWQCVNTV